ncbi:hypothetical protein EC968_005874 [Mortierella alpina]|nr:hypothetical protein EC968_005874 [Mortierella alpina]
MEPPPKRLKIASSPPNPSPPAPLTLTRDPPPPDPLPPDPLPSASLHSASPWPRFLNDAQWMHAVPAFTNDEELARRLRAACDQPLSVAHNESPRITFQRLLEHGLVPDCSSSGIAQYIARTILNWSINLEKPSPFDFRLELGPEQSIVIPSRSRLMIWHIARSLKITIVLLSTRKKSHVFAVERPHATIGFLHRVDSYHGTSEFLVLTKTRTPPVSRISVDAPPALPCPHDAATLKDFKGKAIARKRVFEVNKDHAEVLRQHAIKKARDVIKSTKRLPGQSETEFRTTALEAFKTSQTSRTRLPRGVLQQAATILRTKLSLDEKFTSERIHAIQGTGSGHDNIVIWTQVVDERLEEVWVESLQQAEKEKGAKGKAAKTTTSTRGGEKETDLVVDEEIDKKESIRTCTIPLKSVLRPELVPQMDIIVDELEKKQALITDDIADLAVLAHKAVLRIAAGDAFDGTAADSALDIMDLLPSEFKPRCEMSTKINVAAIPEGLQSLIELGLDKKTDDKAVLDAAGLLSQDFLQFLHTRFMGSRGTSAETKAKHPVWEMIASAIEDESDADLRKLTGLTATVTEAIREFATAINNLWEGSIYKKLLDYLLRVLLRLHLAPVREQKTRDLRKRKALEKQRTIEKKRAVEEGSRAHHKQWLRKTTDLLDQLSDIVESATEEVVRRRVPILLSLLREHQRLEPERREQTRLPSIEESLRSAAESQDKDVIPPVLVDHEQGPQLGPTHSTGVEHEAAEDVEYDSDDEDKDSVFGDEMGATVLETKVTPIKKEPPSTRLKALQAVLRKLLETDTGDELIDRAWVRKKGFRGSDFEDHECDVVLKIGKLLGPFVPKRRPATDGRKTRDSIAHVVLRAPLAVIANTVLMLTGYSEFTRRLSPHISAGSLHALNLGAVGVYEVLSGSNGVFDIKDHHGSYLTSSRSITEDPRNKRAVFASFIDLNKIDQICANHGLVFRERISYVDRYTIRIVGRVVPHGPARPGHPVTSSVDERKKARKGTSTSHNKWTRILAGMNLDKQTIAERAENFKNRKKQLEGQIKAPRKRLGILRKAQTMARRDLNREGTKAAYVRLQEARKAVRQAREDVKPMEQELGRVRREYYLWNKLEQLDMSSQDVRLPEYKPQITTPTWRNSTVEDDVEHMDISTILKESQDPRRSIVYSGTDYGLVKMSETVPVTEKRLEEHLQYFKRAKDPTIELPRWVSHVPKSNKITAQQVNSISHSRRMQKRREKRLQGELAVREALDTISQKQNSLSRATSLTEITNAHAARKEFRGIIRSFETSSRRTKDMHTQRLRTERSWQKLGAAERRHIQDAVFEEARGHARSSHPHSISSSSTAASTTVSPLSGSSPSVVSASDGWCSECRAHRVPNRPEDRVFAHVQECSKRATDVLPIMLIGDAGTAVGSRIGGHPRRGGKKLRQEHMKHCPTVLTDEYKTSRICCYCSEPVEQARGRRIINGKEVTVKLHGSLECTNSACPSVKIGYTIKARDPHSALAIALAGAPALRSPTRQKLAPFSRYALEDL